MCDRGRIRARGQRISLANRTSWDVAHLWQRFLRLFIRHPSLHFERMGHRSQPNGLGVSEPVAGQTSGFYAGQIFLQAVLESYSQNGECPFGISMASTPFPRSLAHNSSLQGGLTCCLELQICSLWAENQPPSIFGVASSKALPKAVARLANVSHPANFFGVTHGFSARNRAAPPEYAITSSPPIRPLSRTLQGWDGGRRGEGGGEGRNCALTSEEGCCPCVCVWALHTCTPSTAYAITVVHLHLSKRHSCTGAPGETFFCSLSRFRPREARACGCTHTVCISASVHIFPPEHLYFSLVLAVSPYRETDADEDKVCQHARRRPQQSTPRALYGNAEDGQSALTNRRAFHAPTSEQTRGVRAGNGQCTLARREGTRGAPSQEDQQVERLLEQVERAVGGSPRM